MRDVTSPLSALTEAGNVDPLTRIADAVHALASGPNADELVARIAAILAAAIPSDVERIVLENAELQHELEMVQNVDPLTGLRNRHRFFEDVKRELAAARRYDSPLSLLVIDVAGLRDVNETRGYDAGDRLLLTIGELLLTRLRITDIAARIGDDDFAVILPRTPRNGAEAVADRVGDTLGDWVDIGVAGLDGTITSGAELLDRAHRDLEARRVIRIQPPAA
jgi:diguanylate cyclase (GGDEF)-like protein